MENGKWVHMVDSAHTGFRNGDDNDWIYPQIKMVNPIPRGKIVVSFRGNSALERTGMFMENEGCICMDASHFTKKAGVKDGSFEVIKRLGRTSDAIKSFPVTKNWEKEKIDPMWNMIFIPRREENMNCICIWHHRKVIFQCK